MKGAAGKLEDEEALLAWSRMEGILHAQLLDALSDEIIALRAEIRPKDKKDKDGNMVKVSLLKDAEAAQKRANGYRPKVKTRPGTGGKTPEQRQAEALKILAGLTPAQIAEVLRKATKN
jgi:hypothetical protein